MMRFPDRRLDMASIAIRTQAYQQEGVGGGAVVPNLAVRDSVSGALARFHPKTGVHGFVNLTPGPRTIEISDPAGRWLPVHIPAIAPDRGLGQPALWVDQPLFPGPRLAIPPVETVVWGTVSQAGSPSPHAFVQVVVGTSTFRGATDWAGEFQIWLRGLPFVEGAPPLSAALLVAAAISPGPSLRPSDFLLTPGTAAFNARFAPTSTVPVVCPIRTRTRVDVPLP